MPWVTLCNTSRDDTIPANVSGSVIVESCLMLHALKENIISEDTVCFFTGCYFFHTSQCYVCDSLLFMHYLWIKPAVMQKQISSVAC